MIQVDGWQLADDAIVFGNLAAAITFSIVSWVEYLPSTFITTKISETGSNDKISGLIFNNRVVLKCSIVIYNTSLVHCSWCILLAFRALIVITMNIIIRVDVTHLCKRSKSSPCAKGNLEVQPTPPSITEKI